MTSSSDHLQSLAAPLNQTSFARAVRLCVESILDTVATTGQERFDNMDMARRWFYAAQGYAVESSENEQAILDGLTRMFQQFNLYL